MRRLFIAGLTAICFSTATLANAQITNRALNYKLAPVAVEQYHASKAGELVWAEDADFDALISAIEGLERHGLNPEHYHLSELKALRADRKARDRIATDAWFSAAAHMLYGKLNPTSVEPDWTAASREADLPSILSKALDNNTVGASLESLSPTQPGYQALLLEYDRLKTLTEAGLTIVADGPALKKGQSGERVTALQTRLVELGWLGSDFVTGSFDEETLAAVKLFQEDQGLDADGVVGVASRAALNRGPQAQLEQVRVNLERWRWLPEKLGRRHLRANIAGFSVTAYKDGIPVRTHLTIVGKTYRKTPVFADEVEYIVFNPWWETPYSLATRDKLPLFRKDPGAVKRLGFQVLDRGGNVVDSAGIDWNSLSAANFPYRLRQAPGEQNALGQVKIMFPNPHNVYLHDTPTRGLFSQRQRAFSSGCLRTQDPLDLAAWLLEETEGWDKARIDAAVATGKETRVNLSAKVPVYILYFTVENDAGGVRYLDDVYGRDPAVLAGLKTKPK